jgi:AcrR family transcriptional regulator
MNADLNVLRADDGAVECARQRIFSAAKELFYRQGIRAVGVEAIAAEAGTTKMTLYRHFSSKDQLIAEILQAHDTEFWAWWDEITGPLAGQPRKQIERLFREFEELACDDGSCRGCPIVNAAVEIVEDDHPARQIVKYHHDELRRRLRLLCDQMGAQEPDRLSDALFLLMGGSFLARLVFENAGPISSVNEAAQVLLDSPLGIPARIPAA